MSHNPQNPSQKDEASAPEVQNNVIEFPTKRERRVHRQKALKQAFEQKRSMIAASLVAVLALVSFANMSIFETPINSVQGSRGLASVDPAALAKNTKWEHKLAKRLAVVTGRETASLGQSPSKLDQLRYGTLEGKYRIEFKDGKITTIHYPQQSQSNSKPKFLNVENFMKEHKNWLPVEFQTITQNKAASPGATQKTYLLKSGADSVAQVHVELDHDGRFLSLKVEQ